MNNKFEFLKDNNTISKFKEKFENLPFLRVFGAGVGEKAILLESLNKKIILFTDQSNILNYKNLFKSLGLIVGELGIDTTPPIYATIKDQTINQNMIKTIYDFLLGKIDVLIACEDSLLYKFPKKYALEDILSYSVGENYKFNILIEKLVQNGYKKCQKIEKPGDFSIKGDIIDIYLANYNNPIRLDFFDENLEKIYEFDYYSNQKIISLDKVYIYPLDNFDFKDDNNTIIEKLKMELVSSKYEGDALIKSNLIVNEVIEGLKNNTLSCFEYLQPFLKKFYSIYDIFENYAIFVFDELKQIKDNLLDLAKSLNSDIADYVLTGDLLPCHLNYFFDTSLAISFEPKIIFNSFKDDKSQKNDFNIRSVGRRNYVFDYRSLENDIRTYVNNGNDVFLFAGSEKSKTAVKDFLTSRDIFVIEDVDKKRNGVFVLPYEYDFSFSFLDSGIICIGTGDLIKKSKVDIKDVSQNAKKRKVFYLPKVGDFVVHETYGIGKCVALERKNLNGIEKDYFVIEYAGGDKLFLPTEYANTISAYLAGEENPKLNKIGGEQFAKIKEKVRQSVNQLAINLIDIYSKREKAKGFVYSADNYLYNEFENAFPYEETPDQIRAIADIKKDMEGSGVMDRLICGDVGYGKTEVALRAIYKAILDGKQVAFLCPTTILSEQHYKTAKERFKDFMVRIAVLNRFRNKAQQEQIVKDVKEGKVDLIIGTHRLLSNDVVFKDLGLLVLDEEQRFGVADKEKIKQLKNNVDVLTLSATPIPRTLNMSLTGIRDISIIETPPKERIAVHTYVSEESDSLILNACKRELARGGQVLFLYNRVENILQQANRVRELLPDAKVGVAHGQMPKKMLEDTIYKLYNREFDILVTTTIIESGIDLPLANTLIVIDADRLGLSELYQLRGRIGRSNRLAYAYFTYNPSHLLTPDAYKRLDAIMEFTELGSGFKIAMRDLEIRGAGNVLGKEQHGHMEKVGYDMYCKLLDSAIKELKGKKEKQRLSVKMDIEASANLPVDYVASEDERIKLYAEISEISTEDDYQNMIGMLNDAYGEVPQCSLRLLKVAFIKNLASMLGVKIVRITANKTELYLYKIKEIMDEGLNEQMTKYDFAVLKFEDVPIIKLDLGFKNIDDKLDFVLKFLKDAYSFKIKN